VQGLVDTSADVTLGQVTFYSPQHRRFISDPDVGTFADEAELFSTPLDRCYLNATVVVEEIDREIATANAVGLIERALDLLQTFARVDIGLEVAKQSCLVLELDGSVAGLTFGKPNPEGIEKMKHHRSLPLSELYERIDPVVAERTATYLFSDPSLQTSTQQKIMYSLRAYRKAENAAIAEDRLLNYWIALENVLTFDRPILQPKADRESKLFIAKHIVSHLQATAFIYEVGWNLHLHLATLWMSTRDGKRVLVLPSELAEKCCLNLEKAGTVSLTSLLENLDALAAVIGPAAIRERVLYVKRFYGDSAFAKEEIEQYIATTQHDVQRIYRLRNKIVHNAHYDNMVLPYYVERVRRYTGRLLAQVLSDASGPGSQTIEGIVLAYYGRIERLLEKLKQSHRLDFLRDDW
jgi:hypothetical protein